MKAKDIKPSLDIKRDSLVRILSKKSRRNAEEKCKRRAEKAKQYLTELEEAYKILETVSYLAVSVHDGYADILRDMKVEVEDVFVGTYVKIYRLVKNSQYSVVLAPVKPIDNFE